LTWPPGVRFLPLRLRELAPSPTSARHTCSSAGLWRLRPPRRLLQAGRELPAARAGRGCQCCAHAMRCSRCTGPPSPSSLRPARALTSSWPALAATCSGVSLSLLAASGLQPSATRPDSSAAGAGVAASWCSLVLPASSSGCPLHAPASRGESLGGGGACAAHAPMHAAAPQGSCR
jgi:hypothetical protein